MAKRLSILVACLLLFVSCAAITGNKPLNPKQQCTVWMILYNSEYDSAMATMTNPASTQAQKDLALKKKAILAKVWNPMKLYVAVVEAGGIPSAIDAQTITDLMNELLELAGGTQ